MPALRFRPVGDSNLIVPDLCLGTMTFGEQNTPAEAHAQLDRALASGIHFIDVAEMYPVPPRAETQGRSEEIVGSWLAGQKRGDIILATKAAGPGRPIDWVRSRFFTTSTILGATSVAQLEENLRSLEVELSPELLAQIDAIHARYPSPAP